MNTRTLVSVKFYLLIFNDAYIFFLLHQRVWLIDHSTKTYKIYGDLLVSDFLKDVCTDFHLEAPFFLFKYDGRWMSLRKTIDESFVTHKCDFKLRMRWFKLPTHFTSLAMLKQFYYHVFYLFIYLF